jgi:16S rRNA (cytidine1402-2'-O)-methyltransferase
MSGTLYLVATPIGNLEDITFRAVRVLREVQLIAAEDTRRTGKLLAHYGISTPTVSLHDHNERQRTPSVVKRLLAGDSVAVVSDAGTPLVSDPGLHLLRQSLDANIPVVPIPGPSAVLTALISSGAPMQSFTYVGFPPSRLNDRKKWCQKWSTAEQTLVFFESPHRLLTTLKLMREYWGDRRLALGRELTKIHEEFSIRFISEFIEAIAGSARAPRGEYTGVVWPSLEPKDTPREPPMGKELIQELCHMTENKGSRKDAIKQLASRYGLTNRAMYTAIEDAKK